MNSRQYLVKIFPIGLLSLWFYAVSCDEPKSDQETDPLDNLSINKIWTFDVLEEYNISNGDGNDSRSAITGAYLLFSYANAVSCINKMTGELKWKDKIEDNYDTLIMRDPDDQNNLPIDRWCPPPTCRGDLPVNPLIKANAFELFYGSILLVTMEG